MSKDTMSVHRRVAEGGGAAAEGAERLRREAEDRMRERIAEGDRAANNRVQAAEDEAADIVKWAQEEAARTREAGRADAEKALADAAGQALAIVGRAEAEADQIRMEAQEAKTTATSEALAIVARAQENADTTTS